MLVTLFYFSSLNNVRQNYIISISLTVNKNHEQFYLKKLTKQRLVSSENG